jgi:hypothetical protein
MNADVFQPLVMYAAGLAWFLLSIRTALKRQPGSLAHAQMRVWISGRQMQVFILMCCPPMMLLRWAHIGIVVPLMMLGAGIGCVAALAYMYGRLV